MAKTGFYSSLNKENWWENSLFTIPVGIGMLNSKELWLFPLEPCSQSEQKFNLNKQYCSSFSVNVNLNFIDFSSFVFNL